MNQNFLLTGAALCTILGTAHHLNADEPEGPIHFVEAYTVSAGPSLRSLADYAAPINIIDAEALARESGGALGAVLDWQPGVSATSFGAGASRPVLRGFDGPRVRIMESGLEAIDVSDTSPDHGVAVEPLLTERIEVLRGPSTLLYGGSAIGGAVNVVGRDIPRQRVDPKGYKGAFETRYDSVSNGETYLGYATVGQDQWAVTVTRLDRQADDYEIPRDAREEDAEGSTLENSYVETELYTVGASWFFDEKSRIGFSFSDYTSLYGVPGHGHHEEEGHDDDHEEEESVSIDLERQRYDLELELVDPVNWIDVIRVRLGYTDYQHTELEGAEIGTVFERDGWELRSEVAHSSLWVFDEGVFGLQISDTDFSAAGEEAFTPPSSTKSQSVFFSEHIHGEVLRYELGGRLERSDVSAETGASDYDDLAFSAALAATWQIDPRNSLSLVLQRSQRHPTSTELYADGPHLATSQYEIGDADFDKETVYGIDLTYRASYERWQAEVSLFYTYFEDYIFAENQGFETDELDTYQFVATDAEFYGVEAQLDYELFKTDESALLLSLMADTVMACDLDADEDLPRIPPMRIGTRLGFVHGDWDAGLEWRYAFKQKHTAAEETETDAYTQLNADLSYRVEIGNGLAVVLFARANNLLDEEIRNHTSFLKDEAPLPGRNVTIGGRFEF